MYAIVDNVFNVIGKCMPTMYMHMEGIWKFNTILATAWQFPWSPWNLMVQDSGDFCNSI